MVIPLGEARDKHGPNPHFCERNEARRRGGPLEQKKGGFHL
jgi:hypothetical protein